MEKPEVKIEQKEEVTPTQDVNTTDLPSNTEDDKSEKRETVKKWMVGLNSDDEFGRRKSRQELLALFKEDDEIINFIIEGYNKLGVDGRLLVLNIIGHEKKCEKVVVPFLINCLNDPEPMVRVGSAMILGLYKERAKSALPCLKKLLKDDDEFVREAAELAIIMIE
jgi:hypothetical protein